MRLRKKNVSRVAAVAVAAVMAVSAAAPVAVAAAPAVNGGTAAVQENSERVIGISYRDNKTEEFIRTGTVKVPADATQITTDMLTDVPENWAVYSASLPQEINSETKFVTIYLVPDLVPATQDVEVVFYDNANRETAGYQYFKQLPATQTTIATSELTLPEGYEFEEEKTSYDILNGYVNVAVVKKAVATTKVVKINFYSEDEEKQIAEPEMKVAADATYVNSSALTAPAGYELCETGDFAIRDGYVYVPVRAVATTKVVKINFYSEAEEKQIEEPELTVAADATYVNSSALTAPEGYELCEVGDFAIRDGYVYVPVKKVTTPDPVDPTPTPDPEPTPAAPISPVATTIGLGAWLLVLGGLILGFFGL